MILIKEYQSMYQPAINQMMLRIQDEFAEAITTHHSTVIKDVYQDSDQKFWVAMDGDTVAGTVGIKFFGKRAEVKRMFVHPDYRGPQHPTASLLFKHALDYAKQKGANEIYLGTMTQFKAAQRFYEKSGLTEIKQDELPEDYKLNPMDSVFYRIDI